MARTTLTVAFLALFCLTFALAESIEPHDKSQCTDPTYACRGLADAHLCGAVKPCIKHVWEKLKFPEDNNKVCDICKEMVKEARDQLQSNETQEELKEVFEGSCKLIPIKVVAEGCIQVVDQLVPEIVEMLASQMDPTAVCTISGLCNGNVLPKLLQFKKFNHFSVIELLQTPLASEKCSVCKMVSSIVKTVISSSSSKQIEQFLLDVCKKEFEGTKCELRVAEYWPLIYAFLKNTEPEAMCQAVHVCELPEYENKVAPPVQVTDELTCEFCESVLGHVKDMITSNSTVEQFRTALKNFCKVLGKFKDECSKLVDEYYDKIFAFIRDDLNPQGMCTMMGLCQPDDKLPFVSPLLKLGPAIPLVQKAQPWLKMIPAKPLNSLNPEVSIFPPDTNYKKDKYNKVEDESTAETNSVHRVPLFKNIPRLIGDYKCDLCEDVVSMVRSEIRKNDTEEEVRKALLKVCSDLPTSLQQDCTDFVNSYTDMLVKLIGDELDPKTICQKVGLCNSGFAALLSLRRPPSILKFAANDVNCELCKQVAKWLETELQDNRTEEAIREALDRVCSVLPASMKDDCDKFVDEYTGTLLTILEQELDPETICAILGLCKDSKKIKDVECTVCQQVLHFLQNELMDPTTQEELKNVLDKGCQDLPSESLQKDCLAFVEEYGSSFLTLLAQEIDPSTACFKAKMCQKEKKSHESIPLIKQLELDTCDVCITVVDYVDKLLEDDTIDKDITKLVEKVCNDVPASIKDECTSLLEAYGPYILQMIGQTADSKQICRAFDLCRPTAGHIHLLGGEKCTFGPSYWCITRAHAAACKAERFCTGVWESRKKV